MAIKPVAVTPVVKPVSDPTPVTNPVTPTAKRSVTKTRRTTPATKSPINPTIKRKIGKIQNPSNPIPTPRPVREKASTDPWKTGW